MKLNSKAVAGLLATAALAFGPAVQADTFPCPMGGPGPGMKGGRMAGDPAARIEQHLSRFKSELKITEKQEPLWQAFAEKLKAEAGQGMRAMHDPALQSMPAPDRMTRKLEIMKSHLATMEGVAASFRTLYEGLTPEQKAIADKHAGFGFGMGPGGPRRGPGGPGGPRGPGGPGGPGGPAPR